MKIKRIIILIIIVLTISCLLSTQAIAASSTVNSIITGMSDVHKPEVSGTTGRISQILNAVIRIIQIAGTGISVLVVTILGVKYMLASASEKAELKKSAQPIIIGCVLLFAAVNLVRILAGIGSAF